MALLHRLPVEIRALPDESNDHSFAEPASLGGMGRDPCVAG